MTISLFLLFALCVLVIMFGVLVAVKDGVGFLMFSVVGVIILLIIFDNELGLPLRNFKSDHPIPVIVVNKHITAVDNKPVILFCEEATKNKQYRLPCYEVPREFFVNKEHLTEKDPVLSSDIIPNSGSKMTISAITVNGIRKILVHSVQ